MTSTVLVTGAGSGFGAAITARYVAAGCRVIACGRRRERLEELATKLGGERVHVLPLDIRASRAVLEAIAALPTSLASIDVLVNNAGLALGLEAAPHALLDDWDQMVDTNIKGLLYVTRAVLPGMVARGRGHIVNIGSVAGSYPYPGGNVYGATKAFVSQLTLNLKSDLLGTPIRVTSIEPGMAETEFAVVRFKGDADKAKNVYRGMQPLTGDDIAEAVFWATSQPGHVNVNRIELMPTAQAFGPFSVERRTT